MTTVALEALGWLLVAGGLFAAGWDVGASSAFARGQELGREMGRDEGFREGVDWAFEGLEDDLTALGGSER